MPRIASKTPADLAKMRRAGKVVAAALQLVREEARPGLSTEELDEMVEALIRERGAEPAFKGYRGFPASICTSINEQVVHGIPGPRTLKDGDILSVDIGSILDGFYGDAAVTVTIGNCSREAKRLIDVTREALNAGLEVIRAGVRISEIGRTIQQTVREAGFDVVRKYTGHGIGSQMHEPPQIPNYAASWPSVSSPRLPAGATVAIEPMVNAGSYKVKELKDGWTVVTQDGELSAHFEHTVAVEERGPAIMTVL